jgi:ATP-dependent RNA helicase DDX42
VRGVDFGLGIGYSSESGSQVPAPRSAAVNSLKTGMMHQFKSSFVSGAASTLSSSASSFVRPGLRGFVSGGTIGGDANAARPQQQAPSFVPASRPAQQASFVPASQPGGNANENGNPNPERYSAQLIVCYHMVISY